jgi:hypothetical protein
MEFVKQATIDAPADRVWQILGPEFNEISNWSSFVEVSQQDPDLADGEGRVCEVQGMGDVREVLYEYDEDQQKLGFTVDSPKNPFFIQEAKNTWRVEPIGDDQSLVHIGVDVKMAPVFKQLMSGRMRKMMEKRADVIILDLKNYAEDA